MENSISRQNVNVNVRAIVNDPNVTVQYKTKILQKNVVGGVNTLVPAMISEANVKYVIKYDYVLSENITIPDNCILEFDGGSLSNGTLIGTNTQIKTQKTAIFTGITIAGTWNVPEIYGDWFSDVTNNNVIREVFNLTHSDINNIVNIGTGTHYINFSEEDESGININSNTTVLINGTISIRANSFESYNIININESNNIQIIGGTIEGDKLTHTGETGEWGHGIRIFSSSNITIKDVKVKDCWGDCIYVGGLADYSNSAQIVISNCELDNGRRQGVSITKAEQVIVENCRISNISGTAPQSGIDIEPNSGGFISGIKLVQNAISNCAGAGITVKNTRVINAGNVDVSNNVINNCGEEGIYVVGYFDKPITIKHNAISGYGTYGMFFRVQSITISEVEYSGINSIEAINNSIYNTKENSIYGLYTVGEIYNLNIFGNTFDSCEIRTAGNFDNNTINSETKRCYFYGNVSNSNIVCGAIAVNAKATFSSNNIVCRRIECTENGTLFIGNDIECTNPYNDEHNYIYSIKLKNDAVLNGNTINGTITTGSRCSISNNNITLQSYDNVIGINLNSNCKLSNNEILLSKNEENVFKAITSSKVGVLISNNSFIYSTLSVICATFHEVTNDVLVLFKDNYYNLTRDRAVSGNMYSSQPRVIISDGYNLYTGTTRPTYPTKGEDFFDETLGKPIWWNGTDWVDATGATV